MSNNADLNARRIVAIADVHGEIDLFRQLVSGLNDAGHSDGAAFFLLGDYVDRGPDSRACLDAAIAILAERPGSRMLLGNHDEWLLKFLRDELDPYDARNWIEQGGAETLQSYGLTGSLNLGAARTHILAEAPGHLDLLAAAEPIILAGDFAFVHAGVEPSRPLSDQDPHDCVWIRAPFMRHEGPLSHVVIHGHTPQKGRRPTATENRISIDTGACFTGTLTAAVIDRDAGTIDFYAAEHGRGFMEIAANRLDRGYGTVLDRFQPSRPEAPKI